MTTAVEWFDRGAQCRREGKHREAVTCFEEVVRLDVDNHVAWFNMANALFDLQDWERSLSCYRNAIKIKLDYDEAWHNMGDVYIKKSRGTDRADLTEAVACCKRSIEIKPNKTNSLANLGAVLNILGKLDEAAGYLRKCVELDSGNHGAWRVLGLVYKKQGRLAESDDAMRRSGRPTVR